MGAKPHLRKKELKVSNEKCLLENKKERKKELFIVIDDF